MYEIGTQSGHEENGDKKHECGVGSGPSQGSVHSSQFTEADGLKAMWPGKVPSVHLNLPREIDSFCKFRRVQLNKISKYYGLPASSVM